MIIRDKEIKMDEHQYYKMLGFLLNKYNRKNEEKVNTKQFQEIFDLFLVEINK